MLFRGLGVLPARNASMADFASGCDAGGRAAGSACMVDQTKLAEQVRLRAHVDARMRPQFGGMGVRVPPPSGDAAALPV